MKKILFVFVFVLIGIGVQAQNSEWPYIYRVPGPTDTLLIWHNDSTKVTTAGEFFIIGTDSTWVRIDVDTVVVYENLYLLGNEEHRLPDVIIMDDYERKSGFYNAFNERSSNTIVDFGTTRWGFLNHQGDTITMSWTDKLISVNSSEVVFSTVDSIQAMLRVNNNRAAINDQFYNKGFVNTGWHFDFFIGPESNDTVRMDIITGANINLRGYTGNGSNNRVDIDAARVLHVHGAVDDRVVVDSLIMVYLEADDNGIVPDSIRSYYGIYHDYQTAPIIGDSVTYFLYSEYGDNYLNGDLEVLGLLKYEPPHASMTFEDESETLTMSQNTWVKITNGTDDIFTGTDVTNITHAGDSLTITTPGDYMVNISLSFSGTSNADVYEFAVFVNEILTSVKIERTTTSTDIGNISLPVYLNGLSNGDDISVRIRNTANDFDATVIACSWVTWLLHAE